MPTRRSFLLGGIGTLVLVACSDDAGEEPDAAPTTTESEPSPEPSTSTSLGTDEPGADEPGAEPLPPSEPTDLTPSDFAEVGACLLLPEEVEGPFYLDAELARRDITDGAAGHPLRIGLMVVDQQCAFVEGAAVDVWHADAGGAYSGFPAPGATFLRGTQVTDANGIVEFGSIFPGWYRGRTVHVHVKVHIDDAVVLTTQLVFDDGFADEILAGAPYADRGPRDTRNPDDPIIGDFQENGTMFVTRPEGEGTLALVVIGVDPSGAGGSDRPLL